MINRQQGRMCIGCGANLRSSALAGAILRAVGHPGPLVAFVEGPAAQRLSLLEVNTAGTLHPALSRLKGLVFATWPEVDLRAMPYEGGRFDVVVHSDTLEHVENPVRALEECCRVLKPGGALCYTVPVIPGRMTRGRAGLPASYHGGAVSEDWRVHTEYGADMWTEPLRAGFARVEIAAVEYPAALALTAWAD